MRLSNIIEAPITSTPAMGTNSAPKPNAASAATVAGANTMRGVTGQSGSAVAKALGSLSQGKTLATGLAKVLDPYADALKIILSDPQLRIQFIRLMKQATQKAPVESVTEDQDSVDAVAGAITRRIMMQHTDLLSKYGPVKVMAAIDDVADFAGSDGLDEIGSSDVSIWTKQVIQDLERGSYDGLESVQEAEGDKPYICLYVKKGKVLRHECYAPTSYEAAKKAAQHWGLKSTAGVSAHLADDSDDVKENEQLDEILPALGAALGRAAVGAEASALARGIGSGIGRAVGTMASDALEDNDEDPTDADSTSDAVDTVTLDVPLLLRVMEYAREDATEDMDLHDVAERMIAMAKNGPLSMDDYDAIVSSSEDQIEEAYGMWKVDFPKQHAGKAVSAGSVHVKAQNSAHAHKVAAKRVGVDPAVFKTSVTKASVLPEDEKLDELSPQTLGSYISKSVADEKERRARGIRVRDELRAATGKNFGTPIDRKLYSPTASRKAGQKRAIDKLTGASKVPAKEGYYAPGPETMPGAVGPQEDTNVSFNQTKRIGDATVTVSANAKDMEELHRVLKLAGIEVKDAENTEPSVTDAAVALAPHMPAEPADEPCGCEEPVSEPKPIDLRYSTDKTALLNVLRDKLKRL